MSVDPAHAGASAVHGGKTYYFCCQHCAARFRAEPAKYLQPAIDPVCGVTVDVESARDKVDHEGPVLPLLSRDAPGHSRRIPLHSSGRGRSRALHVRTPRVEGE